LSRWVMHASQLGNFRTFDVFTPFVALPDIEVM
jgi:hypothetical protein